MTQSPPIQSADFDALLEVLGDGAMREVVQMFVASGKERFAALTAGIEASDATATAQVLHAMRSASGQLGAQHLEALCADGERLSRHGDLATAAVRASDVAREFERCSDWFNANGWLTN
ncbi:MAG: Hpt domain-containing protein [Gemmatimonadetes bacterium]|nr:Hpt domain-containing protein [Gemmatimonadota bacterium]